jgi:hypothetical protein
LNWRFADEINLPEVSSSLHICLRVAGLSHSTNVTDGHTDALTDNGVTAANLNMIQVHCGRPKLRRKIVRRIYVGLYYTGIM